MKGVLRVYLIVCVAIAAVLIVRGLALKKPIDWSENLSRYQATPYGTELVYERLGDLFAAEITTSRDRIRQTAWDRDWSDGPKTHLFIVPQLIIDGRESNALLELAAGGDDVFIAAAAVSDTLEDLLGMHVGFSYGLAKDLTLRFREIDTDKRAYSLKKAVYNTTLDSLPEGSTILAVNGASEPVFARIPYGSGHVWMCTVPLAFTNYQLLKKPNEQFIASALSYLPRYQPLVWDEHYKAGREGADTPLRWLLSNRATKWMIRLAMALILLYMLFRAKREQRPIPVIEPLRNTSRDFIRTVANLYFRKGDHADLSRKMITYFKEDLRQRTYLRHFAYDRPTYQHLSLKLGLPETEVTSRMERIAKYEQAQTITQQDLLNLNNELSALRARI